MNKGKIKLRRKAHKYLKTHQIFGLSHTEEHPCDGGENAITLVSQLPETQMLQNKLSSWVLTDV